MNDIDHISLPLTVAVSLCLTTTGMVGVVAAMRTLRGTTLVGAQCWIGASLLAIAAAEIWLALPADGSGDAAAAPIRYAAATLTFCPLMALLGAKRPQDRAWHFIVFSLWVVLTLPALHVGLLRPGQALSMPPALAWFMLGLVLIGLLNRILTPAWLGGLLFASGQVFILNRQLPLVGGLTESAGRWETLIGLGLISGAAMQAWWVVRRGRPRAEPLDRLWLDFRDLFGVMWALRLAERVNAAATLTNSDLVLRWSGFQTTTGGRITEQLSPDAARVLRQGLENLLRRFVSREWIAARLRDLEAPDRSGTCDTQTP